MREIRTSGSEGGVRSKPSSLPLSQLTLNANFVYTFLFGKTRNNLPPGIRIDGIGGQFNVQTVQIDPQPRFRMSIVVNAQNLTNHTNYTGYSGTMTSAFFAQPTAAQGMRKIDVGLNFNF